MDILSTCSDFRTRNPDLRNLQKSQDPSIAISVSLYFTVKYSQGSTTTLSSFSDLFPPREKILKAAKHYKDPLPTTTNLPAST